MKGYTMARHLLMVPARLVALIRYVYWFLCPCLCCSWQFPPLYQHLHWQCLSKWCCYCDCHSHTISKTRNTFLAQFAYLLFLPRHQPCSPSHTCFSQRSRWSWQCWLLFSQQGAALSSWHWHWPWPGCIGWWRIWQRTGRLWEYNHGGCYDFRRLRQLSTVVVSKVRSQMSLEECKSWTCIVLLGLRAKVQAKGLSIKD